MILKMYSICDSKAKLYYPPIFKNTHGEAEREFAHAVNTPKNNLHDYPEDFDLFYIGEYDNATGKMTPLDTPQHVIKAQFLKKTGPEIQA